MNTDFIIPGKAEELAASFERNATDLQHERDQLTLSMRHECIVLVSKLPMKFSKAEDGTPHALWVMLRDATRFQTYNEATVMARSVRNGNGDKGEALQLGIAYSEAIEQLLRMAHELRASAELRA